MARINLDFGLPDLRAGLMGAAGAVGGIGAGIKERRFQKDLLGIDTKTYAGQIEYQQKLLAREKDPRVRLQIQSEINRLGRAQSEADSINAYIAANPDMPADQIALLKNKLITVAQSNQINQQRDKDKAIAELGLDSDIQRLANRGVLNPAAAISQQEERQAQENETRRAVNLMNALQEAGEGDLAEKFMRGEIEKNDATKILAQSIKNKAEGQIRKNILTDKYGEEKANQIINDVGSISRLGELDNAAFNVLTANEDSKKAKQAFIRTYGENHPEITKMLTNNFVTVSDAAKLVQSEKNNKYTLSGFKKYISNDDKRTEVRGGFVNPGKGDEYFAIIVDGKPVPADANNYILPSEEEKGADAPTVNDLKQAGTFLLKEIGVDAKDDTDIQADFGVLELIIANKIKELQKKNPKINYSDAATTVIKDLNIKYKKSKVPLVDNTLEYSESKKDEVIPVIKTKEERDELPPGTKYIDPNGKIRTK